ncbi:MAG TPA: PaaI family thioesterase [Acidobacteriota bacterium]|nr:PaaI family thioesterase [Acidobacteriota bacterium]
MEIRLDQSPYARALGAELVRSEEGMVEIRLPFREEFLRMGDSDWYHGGVISALADIAGAFAVLTAAGKESGATIDLRIDYLKPARAGDLNAIGRVVKIGRRICRADMEVRDASSDLVAIGRGTFLGAGE